MEQQLDASANRRLLDLPASSLQHIVRSMDEKTKLEFFRTSKGRQDETGCGALVLRASKLQCTCWLQQDVIPRPAFCSLLHWASQNSTDMRLRIVQHDDGQLLDVLHSLLLYPDATDSPSGRVLGRPATYPGITSLTLWSCNCQSVLPEVVTDAFPNLNSFSATWRPGDSLPLEPVVSRGGRSSLQRVDIRVDDRTPDNLRPAANQHIVQQLSLMPSLTSLHVDILVFQALPPAVLSKLKKLKLEFCKPPTNEQKAALKACAQLESLELCGEGSDVCVQLLPPPAPALQVLHARIHLGDAHVPSLLALPHLTTLTVESLVGLFDDYSRASCSWKQLVFVDGCRSDITRIPLHTLDRPVECDWFKLVLCDAAADLAAIKAAKPHLLRCGGIKINKKDLVFEIRGAYTSDQVAEVLEEWAPCLTVPPLIICDDRFKPLLRDTLARLWPKAFLIFNACTPPP